MANVYINFSDYNKYQIEQLRLGAEADIDVDKYISPEFSCFQMQQIRLGLMSGVDVNIYATTKFNPDQMREIRIGLEHGIDARLYADPEVSELSMFMMREELEAQLSNPNPGKLDEINESVTLNDELKEPQITQDESEDK